MRKTYSLISPNGERIKTDSLKDLAEGLNLDRRQFSELVAGTIREYKGWKIDNNSDWFRLAIFA